MIELQIPRALIDGMRASLRAAADESSGGRKDKRFSVFK
jgi:hypothetical protein